MSEVLKGIKVLDFGRYIAGPFCATLLGDLGAEVIRIEKVDGSEDRFLSPITDEGDGALFFAACSEQAEHDSKPNEAGRPRNSQKVSSNG